MSNLFWEISRLFSQGLLTHLHLISRFIMSWVLHLLTTTVYQNGMDKDNFTFTFTSQALLRHFGMV
jgi:hypothetical protein